LFHSVYEKGQKLFSHLVILSKDPCQEYGSFIFCCTGEKLPEVEDELCAELTLDELKAAFR
jgi:hypothetical protein